MKVMFCAHAVAAMPMGLFVRPGFINNVVVKISLERG